MNFSKKSGWNQSDSASADGGTCLCETDVALCWVIALDNGTSKRLELQVLLLCTKSIATPTSATIP